MKITLTLDLTKKNLELLEALLDENESTEVITGASITEDTLDSLDGFKPLADEEKKPAKKTAKAKKAEAPAKEPEPKEESETPKVSLTDVRSKALVLSKAGKQDKLKEIFAKYGATKLSAISEENYSDLMKDLEEAINA